MIHLFLTRTLTEVRQTYKQASSMLKTTAKYAAIQFTRKACLQDISQSSCYSKSNVETSITILDLFDWFTFERY